MHGGFFFFLAPLVKQRLLCYSVTKSCLPVWDPMDYSTPGFPVLHHLPELAQTQVHWVGWWCHPTISSSVAPFSSCLQSFPASGSFPMSWLCLSGGQSIGASASVFPMNIQDWFPLGLSGLIYLQSNSLSRVFSRITVQKHQFFGALSFYGPTLTSVHATGKTKLRLYVPLSANSIRNLYWWQICLPPLY